jgi:hypothetical protein
MSWPLKEGWKNKDRFSTKRFGRSGSPDNLIQIKGRCLAKNSRAAVYPTNARPEQLTALRFRQVGVLTSPRTQENALNTTISVDI